MIGSRANVLGWPRWMMWAVAVFPPVLWAGCLWASQAYETTFMALTVEDDWVENSQAILFLAGSVLAGRMTWKLRGVGRRGWAILYGLGALALFWVAGEEISWGQRIFQIETPAWFTAHNVQREMNLHNLPGVSSVLGPLLMGSVAFLSVLSLLVWRCGRAQMERWRTALWLPHPIFVPALLCVFSYGWVRKIYLWGYPEETKVSEVVSRLQEPTELILTMALVAFLISVLHHLRRLRPA